MNIKVLGTMIHSSATAFMHALQLMCYYISFLLASTKLLQIILVPPCRIYRRWWLHTGSRLSGPNLLASYLIGTYVANGRCPRLILVEVNRIATAFEINAIMLAH